MTTPENKEQEPTTVVDTGGGPDDAARIKAAKAALTTEAEDDNAGEGDEGASQGSGEPVEGGAEAGVGEPEQGEPGDTEPVDPAPEPEPVESTWLAEQSRKERRFREKTKEREDALSAREKALEEQLSEATQLRDQITSMRNSLLQDPIGALEELGIKSGFGDLANILMAKELGEEPSSEFQDRLRTRDMESKLDKHKREIDEKLAELENQRNAVAHEEFQRAYATKLDTHCQEFGDDMPYVKSWYTVAPNEVVEMMYNGAVELAQQAQDAGENNPLPDPAKLAADLNSQLEKKLAPILTKLIELELAKDNEDPTQAEDANTASPKTLRKAHAARTNKRPPANTEEERVQRARQALVDSGVL